MHGLYSMRVAMGLTVSRKTVKILAVMRKNERILTVSRKKMLTVKKFNHKIRSRDLFFSLMCCALMCSGIYNRNPCESVCKIYRMDVVARVDRRFDSSKKGQNNKIINLHDKTVIYTSRFNMNLDVFMQILMYK